MIAACDDEKGSDALRKAVRLLSADGLDGAMMVVEKELESNPDSWEAYCAKADILYFQGLYGTSLQWSEKSLALNPNNGLAWNTKGNALYKLGKYKEAIECYGKAIEIEPLFIRAWYNKKLAVEMQLKKLKPTVHYLSARKKHSDER